MAYITNYNASKILLQSELKGVKIKNRGIFRRPIYFFNWYEETFLKVYQEMLEEPELFFSKIYKKVEKPRDDYTYVIPPKAPAYHEKLDCQFLHSDYKNFEVPIEIKRKGKSKIEEFRQWFSTEVQELFIKDPAAFQARLQARWKILVPINEIERSNSGFAEMKNFTLEELVNEVNTLLDNAKNFKESSSKNNEILKAFQKHAYLGLRPDPLEKNNTSYSEDEVKEVLAVFETEYKKPIKNLLLEYYRVILNPELQFKGSLLESIGFVSCSNCAGKYTSIEDLF